MIRYPAASSVNTTDYATEQRIFEPAGDVAPGPWHSGRPFDKCCRKVFPNPESPALRSLTGPM
jgi:hypothetical protein